MFCGMRSRAMHVSHLAFRPNANTFRTAAPCGGQTTWNVSGLSPERDCSPKRVKIFSRMGFLTYGATYPTPTLGSDFFHTLESDSIFFPFFMIICFLVYLTQVGLLRTWFLLIYPRLVCFASVSQQSAFAWERKNRAPQVGRRGRRRRRRRSFLTIDHI